MLVEISKHGLDSERAAVVFRALADANRLAIFQLLRRQCGPGCDVTDVSAASTVSEIANKFDISLSTVSHHLKELRNAGLVSGSKKGRYVHCRINEELIAQLVEFLGS